MQVGREENHLRRSDGEFTLLRPYGRADDTDDVSPLEVVVYVAKGLGIFGVSESMSAKVPP